MLTDLLQELVLHMLTFLDHVSMGRYPLLFYDATRIAKTCRLINGLTKNEQLWKVIYVNYWMNVSNKDTRE